MEGPRPLEKEAPLVRCLDCGTAYELPIDQEGGEPCPECGEVGWVALEGAPGRGNES